MFRISGFECHNIYSYKSNRSLFPQAQNHSEMFGLHNFLIIFGKVIISSNNYKVVLLTFNFFLLIQWKSTQGIRSSAGRFEELSKIEKICRHSIDSCCIDWHRWKSIEIISKHQREYLCGGSFILQRLLSDVARRDLVILIVRQRNMCAHRVVVVVFLLYWILFILNKQWTFLYFHAKKLLA